MSRRRRPTPRDKAEVARRAYGCCEYCKCQAAFSPDTFSIEHILPLARSGSQTLENLALACQGCNNRKFISVEALDPVNGERVALFHPRLQRWDDHFMWSADATQIIGLTPTGRATCEKLQLNRAGVVNLRRVLTDAGWHPPPMG